MFEQPLHLQTLPQTNKPLRIAARQAHWLQVAFKRYLDIVGDDIGCEFELDTAKLAACFVQWLRAISPQNPKDRALRKEYFGFSAGVMLRELVADMPAKASRRPANVPADSPAAFWPEGVACAMFCLAVLRAVESEEFRAAKKDNAEIKDLRFWWSFKENCAKNPSDAIAFFDSLIGVEPNWILPSVFSASNFRKSQLPADARGDISSQGV
jgi:hypothetical protein